MALLTILVACMRSFSAETCLGTLAQRHMYYHAFPDLPSVDWNLSHCKFHVQAVHSLLTMYVA